MRTARWRAVSASSCPSAPAFASASRIGVEAIEIKPRVSEVLIGGEPAHAFGHEGARRLRHAVDLAFEIGERSGGARGACRGSARRRAPLCAAGEAGAEAAQIGLDRLAVGADRRLERFGRNRQRAGAGDGAEHHRIDHRAALARDRFEIEQQRSFEFFSHRRDRAAADRSGRRPSPSSPPPDRSGWSRRWSWCGPA